MRIIFLFNRIAIQYIIITPQPKPFTAEELRILFEIFLFKGKVLLGPFVLRRKFHYLMAYKIKLR